MADSISVMLVDDQDLIRMGFRLVLSGESSINVVAEAADGQSALAELDNLNGACDVVLMDIRMPHMNGIEATEAIVKKFPETRVLVLTTFDLDEYAQKAIKSGASGFLLKDARPTELVDAIHRVAAGDAVMAPAVTKRMLEQMVSGNKLLNEKETEETGLEVLEALTEREREVLVLIGRGYNNAEISESLFLSESTIKTHVGHILFKLGLRDRIHAVILARELNL